MDWLPSYKPSLLNFWLSFALIQANAAQHFLYLTPATLGGNRIQQKRWEDVTGRSVYGAMLILDNPPGLLEEMLALAPGGGGEQPKMGREVEDAAKVLIGGGPEMSDMGQNPKA